MLEKGKETAKYKRLLGDTLIFTIGNLGSKIILFFMVPLYTSFLTKEEYGTSDLVFTVAQFLVPFVSLVIFDAVIRFGLSKDAEPKTVLKTSSLVFLAGSLVTVAVTPLVGLYETLRPWKWYLCLYVILTMAGNIELNYLKTINKNKAYALISVLHTAVLAGANVLLLTVLKRGIEGYLIATLLGSATTVILALFAGRIVSALKNGKTDKQLLKAMVAYSAPLILNNISWWVIQSSDKIMIEAFVGAAALGLYTAATKIPSLINVIISIFSQAWGISSVREFETSNDTRFYADVFEAYSTVGFCAAIAITSICKPFMSVYVSEEFRDSWRFVPLLLTSAAFSVVASYFGSLYGALKKSVNNMKSTLFAAGINIVANYLFIMWFGTLGAVIGTVISYIFLAFYRMLDVLRFISFPVKWGKLILNCLIVVAHAVLVTSDFYILPLSCAAVLCFVIINRKTLGGMLRLAGSIIRRKEK